MKDVEKFGLCGGDPLKKDNFKDAVAAADSVRDRTNIKRE